MPGKNGTDPVAKTAIKRSKTVQQSQVSTLAESDDKYRSFIENLPVLFYAVDSKPPYSPLYVSPAFERFGYPMDEWLNDPYIFVKVIHPDDREWVFRQTTQSTKTGKEVDYEYRIIDANGEVHWVRDRGCLIRDRSGKVVCREGVMLDITDRKLIQQELRLSEERFRNIVENASEIIYVHDLDGNYLSINQAAERIMGYSRDEALKMNVRQIAAPEHLERTLGQLKNKINGADQTSYEMDCVTKDGRRLTLEINSTTFRKDGVAIGVQGIARDVTERRQAEERLRESETNLAAAQRITHLGSWELEIRNVNDSNENKVRWSDEVYRIFGYEPKQFDVTSAFVYAAVRPEDRAFVSEKFTEAVTENKFLNVEGRIVLPDGSERLVHARAETICDEVSGKPVKMVGTVQDITDRRRGEEALKESEARFRDLFENANDLIYTHNLKGYFTSLNRAGERITGYSRDEALTMNIADVVAPDSLEAAREMTQRKLANDDAATTYEIDIVAKDGRSVSLELSTRLIYRLGTPVGVQGIGRDITERKRANRALKESENRYRQLGEGIFHQVWTANPDGRIDYVNARTLQYFDKSIKEMLGEGWHGVVHPDDLKECLRRWASSLATGELYTTDLRLRRSDGEYRWHRATATCSRNVDGKIAKWFGTNTDINDQKASEEKLNYYARHDTLTHLPNRVEFMNHLKAAIERAGDNTHARFAVLFLDLDRFKVVNDSLGHAIGDRLLIAISERLKTCVRPGDVVARLGGDEFTILLNRTGGPEDVARVAERVQRYLAKPFKIDNYEVFTSASIGIIVSDEIMRSAEDFLRDADSAMYRAKESGKARYEIFDREMHVRNMKLLQVETDLRHAVDRNEFELFYQPIVDLDTGAIGEFEALIRWRHPIHGLVGPDEFIGVAEETGLIVEIGRWVLEESCRQIARWQKGMSTPLSVSVNLSARQLMHPSLTKHVVDALSKTGLKPGQLKLEVTESTVMEHSERALSILSELDALGVSLSTDDFGTGYSSLSYLQRFPFDRLKIDRSFVEKLSDEKGEAIVKTILMLGENLNIEVVAEGVETSDQLTHLKQLGCRLGQGFLFSRPAKAIDAKNLIRDNFDWLYAENNVPGTVESRILEVTRIQ